MNDDDEAALLAELRAISMQSSSASRFADDTNDTEDVGPDFSMNDPKDSRSEQQEQPPSTAAAARAAPLSPPSKFNSSNCSINSNTSSITSNNNNSVVDSPKSSNSQKQHQLHATLMQRHASAKLPPWKQQRKAPLSFHPNSSNNNTNDSPLPPPTASPQSPDRIDIPNEGESAAAATVVEIDGRVASNTNKLVDRVSQARELEDYSSGGGWSNNNSPPLEGGSPTPSGRSSFSLTVAGAAAKGLNSSSGAVVVDKVELIRNQHDQMEEELSHHHHLVESPLSSTKRLTPPWKRKKQVLPKTTHENEEDTNNKDTDAQTDVSGNNTNSDATLPLTTYSPELAVSATTTTTTGTTTTIGGEPRGGPAHDAELLALLKSVSNNSCSRFAADDETFLGVTDRAVSSMEKHPATTTTTEKPIAKRVPPWRKNTSNPPAASTDVANTQQQQQQQMDSVETVRVEGKKNNVIVVATSSPPDTSSPTHQPPIPSSSSPFSSFPATGTAFVGERGGAAEDAELLALLRGVSNQSSSASRFNDSATAATTVAETTLGTNKDGLLQSNGPDDPPVLVENKQRIVPLVPPWKRNAKPIATVHAVERRRDSTEANDKNVQPLAVTPVLESEQVSSVLPDRDSTARLGFKNSELPSTFQGERGGAAEDAELLALLRGVSNKSSAGRFSDDHNSSVDVEESKPDKAKQPVESKDGQANENSLPPWKRKLSQAVPVQAAKNEFVDNPVDDGNRIAPSRGIKSELTSTFRGDRGGSAEDAELLALLKGVSSKSSRDRFNDDFEDSNKATPKPFDMPLPKSQPPAPPVVASIENSDPTAVESETIPRENLSKALTDKNWKVRCSAYDTLTTTLKEMTMFAEALVDASNIFDGLDDLIPSFVEDGNAGALDKALELANLYADSCRGAGDSNRARKIVSSLVKKTALSSRPSTLKLSTSLALKLMEVGLDGQASVHSVVDLLLTDGISSKKPKVVQASASIIVEAAYHFGASSLPLASLCSVAPKWMSHSNALVRDCCIQVLAEICRALKSKAPIQGIVDTMKSAQVSELDSQLSKQPDATPVRTGLRSINLSNTASSPVDALAALEAGNKELESRRFAARSAVNLVAAVSKTDYAAQLSLPKWSEKVAALDKLIECGGERPFKLEQQTSSVNHGPLIADMKKLLSHTHFAVCSKAIQVLSMLAEGVGEKLYPQLRPSLTVLIQLSKDKKLTNAVSSGLDSLFGNVLSFENLLDSEDAIPSALDEKIQKNSIARSTALDFVRRCVERNCNAGPKGVLSLQSANKLAALCLCKLEDSDAAVRKVAQAVLELMQQSDNERIKDQTNAIIETLQISNPRVYKALSKSSEGIKEISSTRSNDPPKKPPSGRTTSAAVNRVAPAGVTAAVMESVSEVPISSNQNSHFIDRTIPRFEDALIHVSSLGIPQWDATEDDGGVLVGLRASKWQLRHDAIEALRSFVESGQLDASSSDCKRNSSSILLVVREQTRGFKESNVNIMKAIIHLFRAICEYCEANNVTLGDWAVNDAVIVCSHKISDKKLTHPCQSLLTATCVVSLPSSVILATLEELQPVKAPIAHEEFLKWFQTFCLEFGAGAMCSSISDIIPFLLKELGSLNAKVKREAMTCIGLLHQQIGPGLKGLAMSLAKQSGVKELLQKSFEENPFDSSSHFTSWSRTSVTAKQNPLNVKGRDSSPSFKLDVPKTDLFLVLPPDILTKLGSKEGKTAWKLRKEAMDEIDAGLKSCDGLLDTSPMQLKQLAELTRGLRNRLTDTQINLRPIAARLVGTLLSVVDKGCQGKLCKIILAPLINSAMNDIKKPMRDGALAAIRSGITSSSLDGGGLNELAVDALVSALVAEVNEAAIRAGGLPDVLLLLHAVSSSLPNLDEIVAARGQPLGEKYAVAVIECLTSSKSETRSAAFLLLEASVGHGAVSLESIKKATEKLKPAVQRSVGPMIAKMSKSVVVVEKADDEMKSPMIAKISKSVVVVQKADEETKILTGLTHLDHPHVSSNVPTAKHPLILTAGKHSGESSRSIIWPEYPEEPHGAVIENLKRAWAMNLPQTTAVALFPTSGIKKQDDAKSGIDMLSSALSTDRVMGTSVVGEFLDFIVKWLSYVLCSKESTTGLQELLSLINDILAYTVEIRRGFTDTEAVEFIPFLLERFCSSKGRFRDLYMEIKGLIESEVLLSSKQLGVVCVIMIDSSPHAKARAQACHMCIPLLEKLGLAGMGKKGVLAAAKFLSQETTMHRVAALDLMEIILSKMSGDIQRLVRICGPNLSDKARILLEERWFKGQIKDAASPSIQNGSPLVRTQSGSPQKRPVTARFQNDRKRTDIFDELPRLSLRTGGRDLPKSPRNLSSILDNTDDRLAFTFLTRGSESDRSGDHANTSTSSEPEARGAAAALRARLLKIREKSKFPETGDMSFDETEMDGTTATEVDGSAASFVSQIDLNRQTEIIHKLLRQNGLVEAKDLDLEQCILSLKMFHAALSRQQHSKLGMSSSQLSDLRESLLENMSVIIDLLQRLIAFAIHSGDPSVNAGMLLPLLSICLATLMALFRDSEFASKVSTEELITLVRVTGTALLDPRLSTSEELNEDTSAQMVRAINKLAVQAATGSERHIALQALMTLQQELCLSETEDDVFTGRLSRVITKLFARVIKAEEGSDAAYTQDRIDMESLICSIEDALTACQSKNLPGQLDATNVCIDMVTSLVQSIVGMYGGTAPLLRQMEDLGIDSIGSALGEIISTSLVETTALEKPNSSPALLSLISKSQFDIESTIEAVIGDSTNRPQPTTPSRDVASLVSRLGRAPLGLERESALEAIREFKATYGSEELDTHLQQLSGAFRDFILDQLKTDPAPQQLLTSGLTGTSVSDRIRNLRWRLQAADGPNQQMTTVVVEDDPVPAQSPPQPMPPASKQDENQSVQEAAVTTTLSAVSTNISKVSKPSPSKLAAPMQSRLSMSASSSSAQTLRERLAARHSSRLLTTTAEMVDSTTNDDATSSHGATSLGRAAALRARLEAVKHPV